MKVSQKGIDLIKHYESLHDGDLTEIGLQPKMDPRGIWTVGYGHALIDPATKEFLIGEKDKEKAYSLFPDLTEPEALELLEKDIISREKAVEKLVKVPITQGQFDGLVSFVYNEGEGNFETSTLLKKINRNPKDATIPYEFSKWKYSGGKIYNGLVKRRAAEAHLYLTGNLKFI